MNKIYLYLIILIMSACETVVYFDIPFEQPSLVMNSVINPDSLIKLSVTENKYVIGRSKLFKDITTADVRLYENGQFVDVIPYEVDSYYILRSGFKPLKGNTYKIEVIEPDYISINSELTIPQVIPVFEIVEIKEVQDNTSNYLEFTISIADSPGDSFYLLEVYYYNYIYDYQQDPPVITDSVRYGANAETADPLLGSTGGFYNSSILFDDQLFKNKTGVGKFRVGNNYFNGVGLFSARFVEISLKEITKDYYLYKKSYELQSISDGNPLAEPVIVYSNIQNGFGIFGGYVQALRDTFYVFQ